MPTMQGGTGASDVNGGAGGYFGGLGGALSQPSLGGGGYVAPGAMQSRILSAGPTEDVPPSAQDPDFIAASPLGGDRSFGTAEKDGLVVIHFLCTQPPWP
jgi:hypothetical protein